MIVKAKITPIVQLGIEMSLPCAYMHNGTWRIYTEHGTVETHSGDLKASTHKKKRNIGFNMKTFTELKFEYENDPQKQLPADKQTQKVVEVFFAQHPQLTYNGKSHSTTNNPIFNLENTNEKIAQAAISFKDKLAIQNRIATMSLEELRDVCDYYGVSPNMKTESDIVLLLADPATGKCMTEENAKTFKETWMEVTEETTMIVTLKKALRLGVIEEKKEKGRSDFYLGQNFLGTGFNDILAYAKREPKIYSDHIVRVVQEKDGFAQEKTVNHEQKKTNEKVEAGETKKTWSASEIQEMRDKLYKLKDEGYVVKATPIHNLLPHTLEKKLQEAEAKKEAAEKQLA